jgi:hypothetical protein
MSIEKINLRKLLQLLFADAKLQRTLLLQDIGQDRRKASRPKGAGGDFYTPFWSDVKDHAAGISDLSEQAELRIAANATKARLYPLLRDAFLDMWREKIRWRNEPFEFVPESLKAQLAIQKLGALIKIENTASVQVWDGTHRIMYPYFSEAPALPTEGARLGFWVLQQALPNYPLGEFRIIDFLRRSYFRPAEVGMIGDEERQLIQRYDALLKLWRRLRDER